MRRHHRSDRGVAMVEFAVIAPLLFALLLGTLTGGILLNRQLALTHAAREGARYGATVPRGQCADVSTCGGLTWAGLVRSQVIAQSNSEVVTADVCVALVTGVGGSTVAVSSGHTTQSGTGRCFDDNNADGSARVQVHVAKPDQEFQYVFGSRRMTLTARAVSRYEQ